MDENSSKSKESASEFSYYEEEEEISKIKNIDLNKEKNVNVDKESPPCKKSSKIKNNSSPKKS